MMTKNYRAQMGYIYCPDGKMLRVRPADNRRFSIKELQKAVGGYVEIVKFNPNLDFYKVYVNEEGFRLDLQSNKWTPELIDYTYYRMDYLLRGNIFGIKIEDFDEAMPTITRTLKEVKK